MNLEQLRAKQSELSARRNTLTSQLKANKERRAALAFDAECDVAAAKKEIADLTSAASKLDAEILIVDAADDEAGKRIVAAEAVQREEAGRQSAREALALLDEFEARGAKLTVALSDFLREYGALCDDFRKLDRLGFPPTTYALVSINMKRSVASALHETDLRQEYVAPRERTTFAAVIKGWAAHVRARAAAVVNKKPTAKAA